MKRMRHGYAIVSVLSLVSVIALAVAPPSSLEKVRSIRERFVPFAGQGPSPRDSRVPTPVLSVDVEDIPPGYVERGTAFPLGGHLWLTARHIANDECAKIVLVVNGENVPAEITFLDPKADLAVLRAPGFTQALAIGSSMPSDTTQGYAFGFPKGHAGGTEDQLLGRAQMRLGGRLSGTAPILAWTEIARYPDNLDSIAGISGGPMLDRDGEVVGIIVAASVMRGRNYTVAPEILASVQRNFDPIQNGVPARDVVSQPVSLDRSADILNKSDRIAELYCVPFQGATP